MKCADCGHAISAHRTKDGRGAFLCQLCDCKALQLECRNFIRISAINTLADTRSPEWWQQFYKPPEPGPSEAM